ncbi:MAG TPA: AI-2E family transporter [Gemmatimonadaceae bacterium]|nr:AI-2E family transporter [Gemmatimonadaceae bacterium]
MPLLQTSRDRAALLILVLAVVVVIGLSPFFSGLLGAAVLYVVCVNPYRWLARAIKPSVAAALVLVAALVLIALPATWLIGLLIDQAPDALRRAQSSDVFSRVAQMRIGSLQVGPELAKATDSLLSWLSSQLVGFVGGATSLVLNIVIAFFGLFYLLRSGTQLWTVARSYIPFSQQTSDALASRFFGVTEATLLGTALIAVIQGALIGVGFWLVDLANPLFWGAVTALASVLPVLGSGLVWLPATIILLAHERLGAAATMAVIGAGVASNVDNLIRPLVYKRVSNIHPMITLVGAFAGVRYFGLLGILLGPLAIAYLFELLHAYRHEYGAGSDGVVAPSGAGATDVRTDISRAAARQLSDA